MVDIGTSIILILMMINVIMTSWIIYIIDGLREDFNKS